MPLDSMITHAAASVANTQPCSISISESPPTPARRNPNVFPAARKTLAPGCGWLTARFANGSTLLRQWIPTRRSVGAICIRARPPAPRGSKPLWPRQPLRLASDVDPRRQPKTTQLRADVRLLALGRVVVSSHHATTILLSSALRALTSATVANLMKRTARPSPSM